MQNTNAFRKTLIFSSRDMTKKEEIMLSDTNNAASIDKTIDELYRQNGVTELCITPSIVAVYHVENDLARDASRREYDQLVIMEETGQKYTSGSPTLIRTVQEIVSQMAQVDEEYALSLYKRPSKNYTDKSYITASII